MEGGASLALLLLGTFLAAFASGLAGFAFALVASGAFLHVLPPVEATALVLAGSLVAQLFTVWRFRAAIDARRLWPFLLGGVLGVPLGTIALTSVDAGQLRRAVGAFLVLYAATMLLRGQPRPIRSGGRLADGAIGAAGGVLGGLAGLSGALPTLWCGLRGWPPDVQRGVYQPYILVMQAWALASLAASGGIDVATLAHLLATAPALLAGVWLGMRAYARVDAAAFRRIVLALLMLSGLALVVW